MPYSTSTYDFSAAFASSFSTVTDSTVTLLALLKLHLGIAPEDTSQDGSLTIAINIAGDATEAYLDRVLLKREVEEYFPHHFGTVILHNPQVDTSEPMVVTLDGVAQTDYSVFLQRGKVGHLSRIGQRQDVPLDWRKYAQVTVTYTAGYDPIPSDIATAIIFTAGLIYQSQGTGEIPNEESGAIKSMSIVDVGSIGYNVGGSSNSDNGTFGSTGVISDTAAQMLTRYKRIAV